MPATTHPVHIDVRRFRLSNGLRVLVVPMSQSRTAAFSLLVAVGSRHDPPERKGLTHLLEHMFFRGTAAYDNARALNTAIESLGAPMDASVMRDHTLFEMPTFPEALPEALALTGEMLRTPTFADLKIEREVVLQEQLDEVDAKGRATNVDNVAMRALFPDDGLGYSVIGTRRTLRRIQETDLRAHLAEHYVGRRMVLAVAGPVDPEAVRRAAEGALGTLPAGQAPARSRAVARPDLPALAVATDDDSRSDFDLTLITAPATHDDAESLALLVRLLDDGEAARMRARLCDDLGLAYEAGVHAESYNDVGLLRVGGAVAPDRLDEVVREAARVLVDLRDEPVSEAELERVRRRLHLDLLLLFDSPDSVASWLVDMALHRPDDDASDVLRRLMGLGPGDIQRTAQRYLRLERAQLAVVGQVRGARRRFEAALAALG